MDEQIIVDLHIHSHDLLPFGFRQIYTFINRKTMPPLFRIKSILSSKLRFVVINAVGDAIITNLYIGNSFASVKKQLKKIIKHSKEINAIIYEDYSSIKEGIESNRPIVLLAVEGGDCINEKLERIKELYSLGVRALTIVHGEDNSIGRSTMNLSKLVNKKEQKEISKKEDKGLTDFGKKVIEELNSLNIVIDLAHSSIQTVMDVCEISTSPVIASHTGARALQESFPRYLTDKEMKVIANTGGIIGVWPFYWKNLGAKTLHDLLKHFKYINDLVGIEHLGFGSDINGIPGITEGFSYPQGFNTLLEKLPEMDFKEAEIRKIMGENFVNLLKAFSI